MSFYTGMQRGAISVVSSASSAWLAVTVIAAVVLFGERVTIGQGLLLAVVLAGIITLSTQPTTRTGASSGILYGLGATIGLGMALAFMDKVTEAAGPMLAVLLVRTISVVPTFLFITVRKEDVHLPKWGTTLLLLAVAGLLDASGFLGFTLGVEAAPIALVAPIASAHPVATVALAVLLIRERPRLLQWAGAALTVAGVIALSGMSAE
jgi:drug/metabolite transporter (DMT)-like permease